MNSALKSTFWILGGGVLLTLLLKGSALARLQFYADKIRGIGFKNGSLTMDTGMVVQNTSNQKIVIKSIACNIYAKMNGQTTLIGNLSQFTPQEILPNSQTVINFQGKLFTLGIVQQLVSLFENGFKSATVIIEGAANADNYQLPINLKYSL